MAVRITRNLLRSGYQSHLACKQVVSSSRLTPVIVSRSVSSVTRPGLKYSRQHEWLKQDGHTATVGITGYAQDLLGDVVYCELPEVGTELEKGDACGTIESVKAVSDIFTPVSGEVTEVNSLLTDEPGFINKKPYDEGWLFKLKVKNTEEVDDLMTENDYKNFLDTQD